MTSKRQTPTLTPWIEKEKHKKNKKTHYLACTFFFLFLWFLLLFFGFLSTTQKTQYSSNDQIYKTTTTSTSKSLCDQNISVYVYNLPPEFNLGLLKDCAHLNVYTNMCPHVENHGLGRPLITSSFSTNWFATHQFIAEMIFHARMENHPCRTWDPNHANLFYVPFYGGLHASSKFRESNHTARDELAVSLVGYLQRQHWWQRHRGKDHFLVLGRTSWDFMRTTNTGYDFGANCLLMLPTVQNMSVLTVERHPWNGSNQHGIPYPSYFHPSTSDQIVAWQNKMRQSERPYLFSFIGAPRRGVDKAAIRDELIKQCGDSIKCMLLKCENGASKCHEPLEVLKVMTESQFCLQAPGDSFTRRSTFDSILSGCIPVFFSPHTAYTQYGWFLPANPNDYSVYIFDNNGNTSSINIEKRLSGISTKRVQQMRSAVIDLIPKLTYAHPNATHLGFQDAVDVSIAALVKHVNSKIRIN